MSKRRSGCRLLSLTFTVVLLSPFLYAQVQAPEYLLGPGDLFKIAVPGVTWSEKGLNILEQQVRVSNSGRIHLSWIGVLSVYGMSPTDLEIELARRLREEKFINDPWVRVEMVEFRSQPVYILGECMQPGQYLVPYEYTVLDLITMAGGCSYMNENEGFGYLYRRQITESDRNDSSDPANPGSESFAVSYQVTPIEIKPLVEGRDPQLNIILRGGDVLHIPRPVQQSFYVVGDVNRPGMFPFPRKNTDEPFTVTRAILTAGGLSRTAKSRGGMLVRTAPTGERQEVAVDLEEILKGKLPDFRVQPNDVIFIPGSGAKTFAYELAGILPEVTLRGAQQAGIPTY